MEDQRTAHEESRDYKEVLDRIRSRQTPGHIQEALEDAIRNFQRDLSRLPTNLMELVQRRYLSELKPAPPGYAYSYNPVYGNVSVIPVTDDGQYRAPPAETNRAALNMSQPALPPPPESVQ